MSEPYVFHTAEFKTREEVIRNMNREMGRMQMMQSMSPGRYLVRVLEPVIYVMLGLLIGLAS